MKMVVYVYTKSGNKKRYHVEADAPSDLIDEENHLLKGQCYQTDIKFMIPYENIDVLEVREIPHG